MKPGKIKRRIRPFLLRGAAFFLLLALAAGVSGTGLVVIFSVFNPPVSAFMLEKGVAAWKAGKKGYPLRQAWTSIDNLSPYLCLAVVAAEDQRFPEHIGFDLRAIGQALRDNQRRRHPRGASTITQQTAKNLFLWPGRSLVRKGLEAYFTTLMELLWTKRRILEVYLNTVELGEGLFGAAAASREYFHKEPGALNMAEAALLAAVLPNPLRLQVKNPTEYVRERQEWIQQQMDMLGGISYVRAMTANKGKVKAEVKGKGKGKEKREKTEDTIQEVETVKADSTAKTDSLCPGDGE